MKKQEATKLKPLCGENVEQKNWRTWAVFPHLRLVRQFDPGKISPTRAKNSVFASNKVKRGQIIIINNYY